MTRIESPGVGLSVLHLLPRHLLPLHLFACLLLAVPDCGAQATAQRGPSDASPAPARPTPTVTELQVFPSEVVLPNPWADAQLLVTALTSDGQRFDATRDVRWEADGDDLLIDARGRVALADPEGLPEAPLRLELHARLDGVSATTTLRFTPTDGFAPDFSEHVQPVLTRLGCNMGTCHGSAEGQNGFQLSLRGYDDLADHRALTDDLAGRRFDPADPAQSLFLLKPTGVVPHEGGKVLDAGSNDYRLLRDWVAAGADRNTEPVRVTGIEVFPADPTLARAGAAQQFAVLATFSDGSRRDVTRHAFVETSDIEVLDLDDAGMATALRRGEAAILARYQGAYAASRVFVMGDRDAWTWQPQPQSRFDDARWIDAAVDERLEAIKSQPSPTCSDADYLRRIHLDLTGMPPTPADVETFLLDTRDSEIKRAEVVDRLLGSTAFVTHWTNRWADLLQVHPRYLGTEGTARLHAWIRAQVASNRPYDEFVRDLLATSGSTWEAPPAAFLKIHREPDAAMEATTQLFLGVRFNCNKCHDHPFEKWTQQQHWQLAAAFADVTRDNVDGRRRLPKPIDAPKGQQAPTVEEIIGDRGPANAAELPTVQDPDGRSYTPAFPYAHAGATAEADATHRQQLAAWLTAAENPLFAKSYVNRVWSYLLGRGLIEPVDDLRAGNPPSHPELLGKLTAQFLERGFDVRWLIRTICRTQTYQRSVTPTEWNADDATHFARALPRRLPAEVLYDMVHRATGTRSAFRGKRPGTRARDLVDPSVKASDGFLDLFGRPARESVCECEREDGLSLGQALSLVNGPTFADAIRADSSELTELAQYERDPRAILRELYLRFLSRPPTDAEYDQLTTAVDVKNPGSVDALPPAQHAEFLSAYDAWEARQSTPDWQPAQIGTVRAQSGVPFERLPDGSVRAAGKATATDVYTVTVFTEQWPITGLRLDALPDDELPRSGPGRASSGNFVLSHVHADLVPLSDVAKSRPLPLAVATADFSQNKYPAAAALSPENDGWAIHPQVGKQHTLILETAAASDSEPPPAGGHLVAFRLSFPFASEHVLGRFRIAVTSSPRPVRHHGLGDELVAALRTPAPERSEEQRVALHRAFLAAEPTHVERLRLAIVQDFAWSLASSPAFLFNR